MITVVFYPATQDFLVFAGNKLVGGPFRTIQEAACGLKSYTLEIDFERENSDA